MDATGGLAVRSVASGCHCTVLSLLLTKEPHDGKPSQFSVLFFSMMKTLTGKEILDYKK